MARIVPLASVWHENSAPFLPGHRTGRSLTEKPCKLRLQGFVRYLMNTVALFGIALSKHKSNIRMQVEETPVPCVVLSREAIRR